MKRAVRLAASTGAACGAAAVVTSDPSRVTCRQCRRMIDRVKRIKKSEVW